MNSPKRPHRKQGDDQRERLIGPEEAELWHTITQSITPIRLNKKKLETSSIKKSSVPKPKKQRQHIEARYGKGGEDRGKPLSFEHGKAPGLDRKTQSRMRRGQIRVERQLDLHGLTQLSAHRQLTDFIEDAYYEGRKAVLVITGKGLKQNGEIGVLRSAVPRWLNESPLNAWIKGFDYAARGHGGEGALYILIRRRR